MTLNHMTLNQLFSPVCSDCGRAARGLEPNRLLSNPERESRKADRVVNGYSPRITQQNYSLVTEDDFAKAAGVVNVMVEG